MEWLKIKLDKETITMKVHLNEWIIFNLNYSEQLKNISLFVLKVCIEELHTLESPDKMINFLGIFLTN